MSKFINYFIFFEFHISSPSFFSIISQYLRFCFVASTSSIGILYFSSCVSSFCFLVKQRFSCIVTRDITNCQCYKYSLGSLFVFARIHYTCLMTLAGTPPTTTLSGTSFVTTAPAAMTTLFPMVKPGKIVQLPPIHTSSPIVTAFP